MNLTLQSYLSLNNELLNGWWDVLLTEYNEKIAAIDNNIYYVDHVGALIQWISAIWMLLKICIFFQWLGHSRLIGRDHCEDP